MSPTAKLFCCLMFVTFLKSDYRVTPSSPDDFPFHQPRKLNQLSHGRLCAVQQPVVGCAHAQRTTFASGCGLYHLPVAVTRLSGYPQLVWPACVVTQLSAVQPACTVTWLSAVWPICAVTQLSAVRPACTVTQLSAERPACAVIRLSAVQAAAQLHGYPWYRLLRSYTVIRGTGCLCSLPVIHSTHGLSAQLPSYP